MVDHSRNWYDEATTKERIKVGIPKENHKMKAWEDKGNTDDGWDIIVKNVDRIRKTLTPTIHTLPNLEQMFTSPPNDNYVALATNPILNKHLNEYREDFANNTRVFEKIDSNPVNDLKELVKTYDFENFIRELLQQLSQSSYETGKAMGNEISSEKSSRDFTRLLGPPINSKGLLHTLNAIVIPMMGNVGSQRKYMTYLKCQSSRNRKDEAKSKDRGTIKIEVDKVTEPVVSDDVYESASDEMSECTDEKGLDALIQELHDHLVEIPVQRIRVIESVQRDQRHRMLEASQ
uniref:Uncharacterized protein n=1 Tax=Tanacetum cinerariifolium TaxID=118510 RepID=A0A6L2LD91_TANCI|nr:hypothetical protein [Tanacetum cinerariifolium]